MIDASHRIANNGASAQTIVEGELLAIVVYPRGDQALRATNITVII